MPRKKRSLSIKKSDQGKPQRPKYAMNDFSTADSSSNVSSPSLSSSKTEAFSKQIIPKFSDTPENNAVVADEIEGLYQKGKISKKQHDRFLSVFTKLPHSIAKQSPKRSGFRITEPISPLDSAETQGLHLDTSEPKLTSTHLDLNEFFEGESKYFLDSVLAPTNLPKGLVRNDSIPSSEISETQNSTVTSISNKSNENKIHASKHKKTESKPLLQTKSFTVVDKTDHEPYALLEHKQLEWELKFEKMEREVTLLEASILGAFKLLSDRIATKLEPKFEHIDTIHQRIMKIYDSMQDIHTEVSAVMPEQIKMYIDPLMKNMLEELSFVDTKIQNEYKEIQDKSYKFKPGTLHFRIAQFIGLSGYNVDQTNGIDFNQTPTTLKARNSSSIDIDKLADNRIRARQWISWRKVMVLFQIMVIFVLGIIITFFIIVTSRMDV